MAQWKPGDEVWAARFRGGEAVSGRMGPILTAMWEAARNDPGVHAYLSMLEARRRHRLTEEPTPEEIAELIRLQSQRWQDAIKVATEISLRNPPIAFPVKP